MENVLEVKNLSVAFNGKTVLNNVSFEVGDREIAAVIGPNGAGKTVLVKTLMEFIKPTAGRYRWREGMKIGYVPQKFSLDRTLPLTVGEFLKLKPGVSSDGAVSEVLELVGLGADFGRRPIGVLSGGELQRVTVAWAAADKPEVLIFDEPEESVDVVGQESIYNLIHDLSCRQGMTVIFVSHDLNIVYRYAGKVVCLNRGRVVFAGAPQDVLSSANLEKIYGEKVELYHHL